MFACDHCDREFETKRGLHIHLARAHDVANPTRETAVCEECGASFKPQKANPGRFCRAKCYGKWMSASGVNSGANSPVYKGGKQAYPCDVCGKPVMMYPSDVKAKHNHFCKDNGGACLSAWRSQHQKVDRVPYYCFECSAVVEWAIPSEANKPARRFCKPLPGQTRSECYSKWQRRYYKSDESPLRGEWVTGMCAWCRELFTHPRWYAEKFHRRFCRGTDCQAQWQSANKSGEDHPRWQGGISTNRQKWYAEGGKEWIVAIYQRSDFACERCGKSDNGLNAHHHFGWTRYPYWRTALWNGICLCDDCHMPIIHTNAGAPERVFLATTALLRHSTAAAADLPLALPAAT